MRTTFTLDVDVLALLHRVRETRQSGITAILNEALRVGLQQMVGSPSRREPYHTRVVDPGECRLPNLDDVAEALTLAEAKDVA